MPVGATLVITKGSTGSLSVSGDSGAGIGGTYYAPTNELGNPNCGTVVIDGGTVTANGGETVRKPLRGDNRILNVGLSPKQS